MFLYDIREQQFFLSNPDIEWTCLVEGQRRGLPDLLPSLQLGAHTNCRVTRSGGHQLCGVRTLKPDPGTSRGLQSHLHLSGRPGTYIQHSHWSSSYNAALSLVQSFRVLKYFHALKGPIIGAFSVATLEVLCLKEPARASKSP